MGISIVLSVDRLRNINFKFKIKYCLALVFRKTWYLVIFLFSMSYQGVNDRDPGGITN